MPGIQELTMIIAAKDQATATLNKVMSSTDRLNFSWGGLAKTVALAGAAIVGTVVGFGVAMVKMGERANRIEDVSSAFRGLSSSVGESMDTLMDKIREATGGMISDFDLMTSANALLRLNVAKTGDQVGELIDVAARLSESMGKEYVNSAESFALAISGGMSRSLREFGLDVQRIKVTLAGMGLTFEDAAQQGKLLAVVMEEARFVLARTGKDSQTLGDAIDRLGAIWQNVRDWIATSAGPFANDIAQTLGDVLYKFGPAIKTIFTGFFEMMRAIWAVAKDTVKAIASAMGIDMDTLATDAQAWGENVILRFAQGMANAFVWVVNVLNQLGNLIANWLAPGSPPRILPEIDKWGRDTIQAYLDGMGEGINYDAAAKALRGIERYFELQMRPLSERLAAIGHERADIGDIKELARLQRRMGYGYASPQQERLAQLRIEEIQAEMKLRDLEAERAGAVTKAQDILFPLERQVALTEALVKATEGLAGIEPPEWMQPDSGFWQELPGVELGKEFQAKMAAIFDPLKQALAGLVATWGAVFGVDTGGAERPYDLDQPIGGERRSLGDILGAGLTLVWESIKRFFSDRLPEWGATLHEWFVKTPAGKLGLLLLEVWSKLGELASGLMTWIQNMIAYLQEQSAYLYAAVIAPWEQFLSRVEQIVAEAITLWNSLPWNQNNPQANMPTGPGGPVGPNIPSMGGPTPEALGADFWTRGPQLLLVGEAGSEHVQITPEGQSSGNTYNLTIHTNAPVEPIIADFNMMRAFA